MNEDEVRELVKVRDVLRRVEAHLQARDAMNAELHMAHKVRPTPLTTAVEGACEAIDNLIPKTERPDYSEVT